MIKPWVRYEDIEEKRDGYYIHYSPVFTDAEFAILKIYIYEPSLLNNVKNIAELELGSWAVRYATPIMVMVDNKVPGSNLRTKDLIGHNYLLGYAKSNEIVSYWDAYPKNKIPEIDLSKASLALIYSGLSLRTYEDVVIEQRSEAKGRKLLLLIMTLWLCVIPALIAFLGWSNPIVSFLALVYSLYLAFKKARELWGHTKKTEKQIAQEKEDLEKEHHHHHCKSNPEAFLLLKSENFKKETLEKERLKIESMRN
ncbi:MAG: hypothetical protein V5789_02750 [Colwellia sp.]